MRLTSWLLPFLWLGACSVERVVVATRPPADAGVSDASANQDDPDAASPEDSSSPDGETLGQPCTDSADCDAAEYCDKPSCGASAGTCALAPEACDDGYLPACSCDGRISYYNDCTRRKLRISAAEQGVPCEERPRSAVSPEPNLALLGRSAPT